MGYCKSLQRLLDVYTVLQNQEMTMSAADYRETFKPRPDRLPRWLWRLWAWF